MLDRPSNFRHLRSQSPRHSIEPYSWGIGRMVAVALVESLASCPFDECGWADLEPAICQLQSVVDRVLAAECARRRSDND